MSPPETSYTRGAPDPDDSRLSRLSPMAVQAREYTPHDMVDPSPRVILRGESHPGVFHGGPLDGQVADWVPHQAPASVGLGPTITMAAPWSDSVDQRYSVALYISRKFVWRTQNGWRLGRGMFFSDSFHAEVERVSAILKFLSRLWGVPPDGPLDVDWLPLMNRDVIDALRGASPVAEWWGNRDWEASPDQHRCNAAEAEAEIAAWREILDGAKRSSKRSRSDARVTPD